MTSTAPTPKAIPEHDVNFNSGIPSNATATTTNTGTNPAHAMIAGYMAGFSGTIVGYPLDSLKVWVQTNTIGKNKHLETTTKQKKSHHHKLPKEASSSSSSSKMHSSCCGKSTKDRYMVSGARRSNFSTAIYCNNNGTTTTTTNPSPAKQPQQLPKSPFTRSMVRYFQKPAYTVARTLRALYSGVTGPLFTVGMVQSVNFATYDATRRFLYLHQHGTNVDAREYLSNDSLTNVALSGSMGGTATALITAPLLMIKINQQITGNSFREAFSDIFLVESRNGRRRFRPFRPYGAAFVPHATSEMIGRAIYVTTYEGLKRSMLASKNSNNNNNGNSNYSPSLSMRERMVCAAGSGILCWGTFFPLDALRNRMYHARSRGVKSTIWDTALAMRSEGAFYRGYSISIVRAGPVAAAVLPVYDLTLEWLSK